MEDNKDLMVKEELDIPDYVVLKEKYNCEKCKLNKKNAPYKYRFPYNVAYRFFYCEGDPKKRTECKKRSWLLSDLFCLITTVVMVITYVVIYMRTQNNLLALAYTIIFGVAFDGICYLIEKAVDKVFEYLESSRKRRYDKKYENIIAMRDKKKKEEELANKCINDAKMLFSRLSNEHLEKIEKSNDDPKRFKRLKKELYLEYKDFIQNIEELLEKVNLDNFYFSEVKIFFQLNLVMFEENLVFFIEAVENESETAIQIEELIKLLMAFSERASKINEALRSYEAENHVYKMQALRKVVSHTKYEEE